MDMKGRTCLTCNKKFHACGSCDMQREWEWKYCSENCWEGSEEYKTCIKLATNFIKSLDTSQLNGFISLGLFDGDYEYIIDGIADKELKERKEKSNGESKEK